MAYPPTLALWQLPYCCGIPKAALNESVFSTSFTLTVKPLSFKCSTHSAQHPQVGVFHTSTKLSPFAAVVTESPQAAKDIARTIPIVLNKVCSFRLIIKILSKKFAFLEPTANDEFPNVNYCPRSMANGVFTTKAKSSAKLA